MIQTMQLDAHLIKKVVGLWNQIINGYDMIYVSTKQFTTVNLLNTVNSGLHVKIFNFSQQINEG